MNINFENAHQTEKINVTARRVCTSFGWRLITLEHKQVTSCLYTLVPAIELYLQQHRPRFATTQNIKIQKKT